MLKVAFEMVKYIAGYSSHIHLLQLMDTQNQAYLIWDSIVLHFQGLIYISQVEIASIKTI